MLWGPLGAGRLQTGVEDPVPFPLPSTKGPHPGLKWGRRLCAGQAQGQGVLEKA